MTRSMLLSVSRDCSVVAETSLRGEGGILVRGRTGIILGAEEGMVPLMLGGETDTFLWRSKVDGRAAQISIWPISS